MSTGSMLRRQAAESPWKTWAMVVGIISASFMAGMNVSGFAHILDDDSHVSDPLRLQITALGLQLAVLQTRLEALDREQEIRFDEIDKRLGRMSTTKGG